MTAYLTFVVTLFALGFLIFLHELGHFAAALLVGARVKSFNVGLGKCLYSFVDRGVVWRLNILPIGGAVEIEGMQYSEGGDERSYYNLHPWKRLVIVAAGPIANLIVAYICFSLVFALGGRAQPTSDASQHLGYVVEGSPLYEAGLRPGDRILSYDGRTVEQHQDHILAPLLASGLLQARVHRYPWSVSSISSAPTQNEMMHPKAPFEELHLTVPVRQDAHQSKPLGSSTLPASMLIVSEIPITQSEEVEPGDQIMWVNGERIFSRLQISQLINSQGVYLLVERQGQMIGLRAQTLLERDLDYHHGHYTQATDWLLDFPSAGPFDQMRMLPYLFSPSLEVQELVGTRSLLGSHALMVGDRLRAINGVAVESVGELLHELQKKTAMIIFYRPEKPGALLDGARSDEILRERMSASEIDALALSLSATSQGSYLRPKTFELVRNLDLNRQLVDVENEAIKTIPSERERHQRIQALKQWSKQYILGFFFHDQYALIRRAPHRILTEILEENLRTLYALVSGGMALKWISGPVGVFITVYKSHYGGISEQIYKLGFISVGLAFFNFLPLPVLDGGHMIFNTIDLITPRRISPIWLERLTLPFVFILLGILVYATYLDVLRLLGV